MPETRTHNLKITGWIFQDEDGVIDFFLKRKFAASEIIMYFYGTLKYFNLARKPSRSKSYS